MQQMRSVLSAKIDHYRNASGELETNAQLESQRSITSETKLETKEETKESAD